MNAQTQKQDSQIKVLRPDNNFARSLPNGVQVLENFRSSTAQVETPSNRVEIRVARTEAQKEEIYRFRYEHYVVGMGRDKKLADHTRGILCDALDETAVQIGAYLGGELVGCGRINFSSDSEFPEEELYGFAEYEARFPGKLALISKVIVKPILRGSLAYLEIAKKCFEEAAKRSTQRAFLATSDRLVPLLRRLGFVAHRQHFENWADYGSSNPLIIDLGNLEHLRKVKSSFLEIAQKYYGQPDRTRILESWLYPRFQNPFEQRLYN